MEFEEMRKIWDSQNNEPLYVINETALHKRIRAKSNRASFTSNVNEIGLMIVTTVTSIVLLTIERDSIFSYISAIAMFLIGVYVLIGRVKRKKIENQFDRSILGDLDQAIANINNEIVRARTFIWWMIAPVAIPAVLNLTQAGVPVWKWVTFPVAMLLALYLVRWEMKRCHIPRKRELEVLRSTLIKESEQTDVTNPK